MRASRLVGFPPLVGHPKIEIADNDIGVGARADIVDHLGGLRPQHDQVANDDFLVGILLVDFCLYRFQLRQLGMDVRIQDEFHDTLPFGYDFIPQLPEWNYAPNGYPNAPESLAR